MRNNADPNSKSRITGQSETGEQKLRALAAGFIPGWGEGQNSGPLAALIDVAGHYDDRVSEVLYDAENKARLAALDAMGAVLRPGSPAGSVVVFEAADNPLQDSTVLSKGTVVAASIDGETIPFETEDDIALIKAPLDQIIQVSNREIIDVRNGYQRLLVTDYLYIPLQYSVLPGATITIDLVSKDAEIEAAQVWGDEWKSLTILPRENHNADTAQIKLSNDGHESSLPFKNRGSKSHWIRLAYRRSKTAPKNVLASVSLSAVEVVTKLNENNALPPDQLLANAQKVDPTSAFAPFGESPVPGATLLIVADEILNRRDATLQLSYEALEDAKEVAIEKQTPLNKLAAACSEVAQLDITKLLTIIPKLHKLLKKIVPFYSMVIRVLCELADLVIEWGKKAADSVLSFLKSLASAEPPQSKQVNADSLKPDGTGKSLPHTVVLEIEKPGGWYKLEADLPVAALSFDGKGRQTLSLALAQQKLEASNMDRVPRLRFRLVSGAYGELVNVPTLDTKLTLVKPPRIADFRIAVEHVERHGREIVKTCVFVTAFQFAQPTKTSNEGHQKETSFFPHRYSAVDFEHVSGRLPLDGLYIGFDGPLPNGSCSLFAVPDSPCRPAAIERLTIQSAATKSHEPKWLDISLREDRTYSMTRSGILRFSVQNSNSQFDIRVATRNREIITSAFSALTRDGQQVSIFEAYPVGNRCVIRDEEGSEVVELSILVANGWKVSSPLSRDYRQATLRPLMPELFGLRRSWLHITGTNDRLPQSIQLNAVSVVQVETHQDETLGESTGRPKQAFRTQFAPILPGETVEVLELAGRQAELEFNLLKADLAETGIAERMRVVRDAENGAVEEVWVLWERQDSFAASGPNDRHYVIDRIRGMITFGDGIQGRIPRNAAAIVLAEYRHGGGTKGNVPAGAITQILSPVTTVSAVTNSVPGEAGSDGDSLEGMWDADEINPQLLGESRIERFLRQNDILRSVEPTAVESADFESIVMRTSSEVSAALMLRPQNPGFGKSLTSELIVLPVDHHLYALKPDEDRIPLSETLERRLNSRLAVAAPSFVASRVKLRGPRIRDIQVGIVLSLEVQPSEEETIKTRVKEWLQKFYFNPIIGGPRGEGWLSDSLQPLRSVDLLRKLIVVDPRIESCSVAEYVSRPKNDASTVCVLDRGEVPRLMRMGTERPTTT